VRKKFVLIGAILFVLVALAVTTFLVKQIEGERFREAVKAVDELTGSDNVGFMDRVDAKLAAERRERNRAAAE
jgi:hypothetical protein